jgi:hypothetical protein
MKKGGQMQEFLAIVATFVFGLSVTAIVAVGLEHRQLANSRTDENADVRPGIIKVTAAGYAVAPALTPAPIELGFQVGRLRTDL